MILIGAASILLMPSPGQLATTLTSYFDLGIISPALADVSATNLKFRYVPPKRSIPKQTQGTGSRGCPQSLPVSLKLLVPNDHMGQTVSGHPAFFWYVSEPSTVPVEFALVEPGVTQPLFVQQLELRHVGIKQLTMPKNLPELVAGKKYRWSVTLMCNSNRQSSNVFIQSWVQRVPSYSSLNQQLKAATSFRDRASIYAQSGLWYDALETIWAADVNPNNVFVQEARLSLLEQVGLNDVAAQERQRLANK